RDAPEADHRAAHAADQARTGPEAQARQHPALAGYSSTGSLRSSQPGSHHTRRPARRITAGSSTSRTIVASSTTAIVSPTPNWRSGMTPAPAKATKTAAMIAAEPVITPAVW